MNDVIPRCWAELDLAAPGKARRRRLRQFVLALVATPVAGLAGLWALNAAQPPISPPSPPPAAIDRWTQADAHWLEAWRRHRSDSVDLISLIADQTPQGLVLTSLRQDGDRLILTGQSSRRQALDELTSLLQQRSRYRSLRARDVSAAYAMTLPVQQFIVELSHPPRAGAEPEP